MKNFVLGRLIKLQRPPPQTQKEEACYGCQLQSLCPAGHLCTWRDVTLSSGICGYVCLTERWPGHRGTMSVLVDSFECSSLDMCLVVKTTLLRN